MRSSIALLVAAACSSLPPCAAADPPKPRTLWQGELHLGDNPEQYPKLASGGMALEVPWRPNPFKKQRLTVKAVDIMTLAGDGHYVEVRAHHEDVTGGETKDERLAAFRLSSAKNGEREYVFEFDPAKAAEADFLSIKIKIDAHKYGLWDDFVVKQIVVQDLD